MYVGLSIRDECERLVKNQVSKVESVDFVTGSQVARKEQLAKRACVEHMTGRTRVVLGCHFCDCLARRTNSRRTYKSLCLAKSCVCFTKSVPTLYIPSLPTNYKEFFSERKP